MAIEPEPTGGQGSGQRFVRVTVLSLFSLTALWLGPGGHISVPEGHVGVILDSPDGPSVDEIHAGWHWSMMHAVSDIVLIRWSEGTAVFGGDGALLVESSAGRIVELEVEVGCTIEEDWTAALVLEQGDPPRCDSRGSAHRTGRSGTERVEPDVDRPRSRSRGTRGT